MNTRGGHWRRSFYSSWYSLSPDVVPGALPWQDQTEQTAPGLRGFQGEDFGLGIQSRPGHLVPVPSRCQCVWLLSGGPERMWYKMGSPHTLSLCCFEMLPGALATATPRPSWLRLPSVADGRAAGVVGPRRGCLGKAAAASLASVCLGRLRGRGAEEGTLTSVGSDHR